MAMNFALGKSAFGFALVASGIAAALATPNTASGAALESFTEQLLTASQGDVRVTTLRASSAAASAAAMDVGPLMQADSFQAEDLVINSSSCSVAVLTSLPNAARCDVSTADDDGNGIAGIGVDNQDHGARLVDFPSSITVGVGTYVFQDWLDVLRVLWAGADNSLSVSAGGGNGQTPGNRAARCGSPVRRALVANWDNVVEDLSTGNACGFVPAIAGARPASCENPLTGAGLPLRHLFRPADDQAVTSTFLSALGLAAINQAPFCNGTDLEDNDPIRVACSTNSPQPLFPLVDNATQLNDEICGADQTTGLVLPVRLPQLLTSADALLLYPVVACDTGHFEIRRPPKVYNDAQKCPDGAPYLFTGCLTPVSVLDDCRCVNAWTNRAPGAPDLNPSVGGLQNDGRIWNRFYRSQGTRANRCPMLTTADFSSGPLLADARMRYRTTTINGLPVPADRVCRYATSTEQIGCLSRASECSIGFEDPNALANDARLPYTAATLLEGPTCF